ncbi:hypothetical protein Tco_0073754 [Tanacetum coccineum]
MNSSMDNAYVNAHECEKCLKLETELLNKMDFIEKETYDKLFRSFTTLEKHCIFLEEKDLVITALKNELKKLKGKDLADNVVTKHPIAPEMLKFDVEPITPRLMNNRTAHSDYLGTLSYASGSQPSGNTKKDKIQQTPRNANVQHSKLNANSELLCVKCNGCMLYDNHDLRVLDFINDVNARTKSKSVKKSSKRKVWKPTGVVELYFVNTEYQLADIFTKALGREIIEFLINIVWDAEVFTAGRTYKQLADEADRIVVVPISTYLCI